MYATLLRLGLWIMILVLGLYVAREANPEASWSHLVPSEMLTQGLGLAAALIVLGIVARVLGFGVKAVAKNRCAVCKTAIPAGAIYCRAHLRSILHEEDDKAHEPIRRR